MKANVNNEQDIKANLNSEQLISTRFLQLESIMFLWGSTLLEINNGLGLLFSYDFQENVPALQLALGVGMTGLTGNGSNNDFPEPNKNITNWICYTQ